jgi:hypothetical protein
MQILSDFYICIPIIPDLVCFGRPWSRRFLGSERETRDSFGLKKNKTF